MLEVISVLPLLTAPVEIPTVTDLLEEKEQELHLLIEENTEQTQQELVQQLEAKLEEREREREEAERQAEQARAEEARRLEEENTTVQEEQVDSEPVGVQQTDYAKWEPIARCESGYGGEPDWSINTGNGFYGGLQFTLDSWRWVGGEGYPHHASKEEQIYRAEILLERQGWVAWPACSKKVGYR